MSIRKSTPVNDLTEEEVKHFKDSKSVPDEVKAYLLRQHENLGTKSSGYRKIANAAQAELDAVLAIRDLNVVYGELATAAQARAAVEERDREIRRLNAQIEAKDAKILQVTARPALAVHSGER